MLLASISIATVRLKEIWRDIMKCPFCSYPDTKVVDSRDTEDFLVTRRRRECEKCGERFTTYERIELNITVVKRDGSFQNWSRDKVIRGIMKACEKRKVSRADIERIVDEIEQELRKSGKREISSQAIGDRVIEKLKELDKVAYIRFASVYKQFEDIESFERELRELKEGEVK